MKALVTGGGGFLGSNLVKALVARGDTVRIIARGEYPELAKLGVACVRGVITDAAAMQAACEGMDVVFHTAASATVPFGSASVSPWASFSSPIRGVFPEGSAPVERLSSETPFRKISKALLFPRAPSRYQVFACSAVVYAIWSSVPSARFWNQDCRFPALVCP